MMIQCGVSGGLGEMSEDHKFNSHYSLYMYEKNRADKLELEVERLKKEVQELKEECEDLVYEAMGDDVWDSLVYG